MKKMMHLSGHLSKQLRDWPRSPNVNCLGVVLVGSLGRFRLIECDNQQSGGFTQGDPEQDAHMV